MFAKIIQREALAKTLTELKIMNQVHFTSPLAHYRPEIAPDGLIRSKGRLSNQPHLTLNKRCPIILHYQHPAVKLYMEYLHRKRLRHFGGPGQIMAALAEDFLVPGARTVANRIVKDCIDCRAILATRRDQAMADLPWFRMPNTASNYPFEVTGVDCFGPIAVKRGRSTRTNPGTEKEMGRFIYLRNVPGSAYGSNNRYKSRCFL